MNTIELPDLDTILTCSQCDGEGTVLDWDDCPDCDSTNTDCDSCNGDGTIDEHVDCTNCHGSGNQRPDPITREFLTNVVDTLAAFAAVGWQIDPGTACCQSCAFAADIDETRPFIGFHAQDLEHVAETGTDMYLFHHLPDPDNEIIVRHQFAVADLTVEWDGTDAQRIRVGVA